MSQELMQVVRDFTGDPKYLNWGKICEDLKNPDWDFIQDFADSLYIHTLIENQNLSTELICQIMSDLDLVAKFNLDPENLMDLCLEEDMEFSEAQLEPLAKHFSWGLLLSTHQISEDFMVRHVQFWAERYTLGQIYDWSQQKGWNFERLKDAYQMLRLLND